MFWTRKKRPTVHVEFVDADTGALFGQTDISPDQLPASFEADTTMHLGDRDFSVVSATPMTAVEFRASGRLRLVLRRVKLEKIAPGDVLFSLPTISDTLPTPAEGTTKLGKQVLELHEDDWRQVEFFGSAQGARVDAHLAAIRSIHERERSGPGFKRLHVRKDCEGLLADTGCTLTDLRDACPAGSEWLEGVALQGLAGIIPGSFAVRLPSSITLYGTATDDRLDVLAVHAPGPKAPAAFALDEIAAFASKRGLGVADWCRASRASFAR